MQIVIGAKICPSSLYSFQNLLRHCANGFVTKGFVTKELSDLHCWYVSHILGSVHHWFVTYQDSCIKMRDCCYITSTIAYWGKSSTVGWYQVLGFLLLVTVCFDNSGFSGVVILNLLGGVLPQWFFPIHKQITCVKFNFCCI